MNLRHSTDLSPADCFVVELCEGEIDPVKGQQPLTHPPPQQTLNVCHMTQLTAVPTTYQDHMTVTRSHDRPDLHECLFQFYTHLGTVSLAFLRVDTPDFTLENKRCFLILLETSLVSQ